MTTTGKKNRHGQRSALDLMEEAAHLIRMSSVGTVACYYIGTVPFVLALLFFWGDMSGSSFADERLMVGALMVAVLYLWMKCWQAVYTCRLHCLLRLDPMPRWTWGRLGRLMAAQTAIQSTGLVMVPVSALVAIPLGWVLAFYHSATVTGDGEAGVRESLQRAMRLAMLWPVQNHLGIVMAWLFAILMMSNVMILIVLGPWFLQAFLGVKTLFMMNMFQTFNTTFLAASVMITYMLINPLMKAFYVLRCFYGNARLTGADLRAELARSAASRGFAIVAVTVWLVLAMCDLPVRAEDVPSTAPRPRSSISASDLDRSIDRTLEQREYTWRQPREWGQDDDGDKTYLDGIVEGLVETVVGIKETLSESTQKALKWVHDIFKPRTMPMPGGGLSVSVWTTFLKALTVFLFVGLVVAVAYTLHRAWKRRRTIAEVLGETVSVVPDVADENVTADQLPSDGWMLHARELMERGELRLAMRALYLASLAMLGQRELIVIVKSKSNREYERELQRRAHGQSDLLGAFGHTITMFENAWYGMHDVTGDMIAEFTSNVERIRLHAQD